MKTILLASAAVLCAQSAFAGGIGRSATGTSVLFEDGNYAEFSLSSVQPDVSGTFAGADSGNVTQSYTQIGAAYKWGYSGPWEAAVMFDQPVGADISYPANTSYALRGSTATLDAQAVTVLTKYQFDDNISIFGGLRAQSMEMEVSLPAVGYTASGANQWGYGYVVGGAYEKPEIALRVALTYNSAIDYSFDTTENGSASLDTDVTSPQSISLDFQTGIAADTLLFGSVNWVNWSKFDISPFGYVNAATNPAGDPLVSYDEDTITFTGGIGRKFSEQWSGGATITYEASGDGTVSNLGPTDGRTALGLGATYSTGQMEISGGVQYIMLGDAQTEIGAGLSDFTDNTALAFGLTVGMSM